MGRVESFAGCRIAGEGVMVRRSCRTWSFAIRAVLLVCGTAALAAPPVHAQGAGEVAPITWLDAGIDRLLPPRAPLGAHERRQRAPFAPLPPIEGFDRSARPRSLPTLYVAFGALQALDAHSTLRAVQAGRAEANPVMRGIVERPGAFVVVKAVTATATIVLAERLWRRHPVAAVATMIALNAVYAAVVANNYRHRGR